MASGKTFTQTDSWAVAIAFVVFAILSVLIEKAVHWLKHSLHSKKTLLKVVHKAEEELFLLGSVSFILLVFEDMLVANTCVKTSQVDEETWAMCPYVGSYDASSYASSYERVRERVRKRFVRRSAASTRRRSGRGRPVRRRR